jgi:hypothetical protein
MPQTVNLARLRLEPPRILWLPKGTNALDLAIKVVNLDDTPADCIWVELALDAEFSLSENRRFIPFIPGNTTETVTFPITTIPERLGYIGLRLKLSYFDPVERQEINAHAVPTLKRDDRPFQLDDKPYRPWSPHHPLKPEYLTS